MDYHQLKFYWRLLKPRVMSLVVFTGIVGLWLAPGRISSLKASIAILCIALGSGAAGALNMWYERDVDALMERTKTRPLPQGKIQPNHALIFALTLAISSVLFMFSLVNILSAFYLAIAILLYMLIYAYLYHGAKTENASKHRDWRSCGRSSPPYRMDGSHE